MNWVAVLSSIFALIGGAMLVATGRQFSRRRVFGGYSAIASGTIVAFTESRESGEVSYFPNVKFQTPSGHEVTFQSAMGSTSQPGQIGSTVSVRYRPDQPHVAEINSFMALWGLTLLFGVLGVVFLFVGLGIVVGSIPV